MVNSSCDNYIVLFIGSDRFEYASLSHKINERYSIHILQAKDNQEALTAICSDSPDLIILNWRVPDFDTMGLIHEIRSNEGTQDTPLILKLVGVETAEQLQEYRSAGIDDFLPRPIKNEVLFSVLDKWLK